MGKNRYEGSGETRTFEYLRIAARVALEHLQEPEQTGQKYYAMQSMVFCAFAIEAFLNHLGNEKLQSWDSLERKLSPEGKLDLLLELNGSVIDKGTRPFQTFKEMMTFRNMMAHGRTEITTDPVVSIKEDGKERVDFPTKWQKAATEENANRFVDDLDSLFHKISVLVGIPFTGPGILGGASYKTIKSE